MAYFLYLLGFAPSLIWLIFYLKKDAHPEPNKMILKVFFFGMFAGLLAIVLEKSFSFLISISFLKDQKLLISILFIFLTGALLEEYLKYLVIRFKVLKSPELDEPFDIFLYMIISALGFAALENILVLSNYHVFLTPEKATILMILRFISTTFLHTLCSGLLGIFIYFSFFTEIQFVIPTKAGIQSIFQSFLEFLDSRFPTKLENKFHKNDKKEISCNSRLFNFKKKRKWLFRIGFLAITLFHGFYNFSMATIHGPEKFILPLIILIITAFLVFWGVRKMKMVV